MEPEEYTTTEIPIRRLHDIPMTRLDNVPITIMDDIIAHMNSQEIIQKGLMRKATEQNIPLNELLFGNYISNFYQK